MRMLLVLLFSFFSQITMAKNVIFVTPTWLKNQAPESVLVFDTRSSLQYNAGHLAQAISFPVISTFTIRDSVYYVKDKQTITGLLQEKGVSNEKAIVLYDDGKLMSAARMFWVLELYGINRVYIIKSSYDTLSDYFPTTLKTVHATPSDYIPAYSAEVYADARVVNYAANNKQYQLIDSRTYPEYLGSKSVTDTKGHIPNAIHFDISKVAIKENGRLSLKHPRDVTEYMSNFDRDKRVVTYCNKGFASTLAYVLLKEHGFDVAHYDGSWLDWSERQLPVEKK